MSPRKRLHFSPERALSAQWSRTPISSSLWACHPGAPECVAVGRTGAGGSPALGSLPRRTELLFVSGLIEPWAERDNES